MCTNMPRNPGKNPEKAKARQKTGRVSVSVLEEGENGSWQHLRVICNDRSLSFSEWRMFLNPPPAPLVNLYQVTEALMELWGFLRDVSNISSLEKIRLLERLGVRLEVHQSGGGSGINLVMIRFS